MTSRGFIYPRVINELARESESSSGPKALKNTDSLLCQPAEPWSPLKNELRRKYLTQVDVLLQDEGCLEVMCFPGRVFI